MPYMQDTTDSAEGTLLESGCYAFDRKAVCQFQIWGVSNRLQKLLDVDGNWHSLLDCSFVRSGVISVSAHRRRDTLFPKVDWNDQVRWDISQFRHIRSHRHHASGSRKRRAVANKVA